MTVTPIAAMGIFGETTAIVHDNKMRVIGTCIDTPNGIAKMFMECNRAEYVKTMLDGLKQRYTYNDRMGNFNSATSYLKLNG